MQTSDQVVPEKEKVESSTKQKIGQCKNALHRNKKKTTKENMPTNLLNKKLRNYDVKRVKKEI